MNSPVPPLDPSASLRDRVDQGPSASLRDQVNQGPSASLRDQVNQDPSASLRDQVDQGPSASLRDREGTADRGPSTLRLAQGSPGSGTGTQLQIKEFDYQLPDESVAKYPLALRDHSKLLVWKEGVIEDHRFSDLPGVLPEGSLLVFNNTHVIKARLHFIKSTGAKIEVFCLEPTFPHDYVLSFAASQTCRWKCIVGNLKRWKEGVLTMNVEMGKLDCRRGGPMWPPAPVPELVEGCCNPSLQTRDSSEDGIAPVPERSRRAYGKTEVVLSAERVGGREDGSEIRFSWDNPNFTFAEILEAAGNIPIPPYLHRESEEIDSTVYQTVYSKIKGSVAAPTAGLHFTSGVFEQLTRRNITCEELTLHVGAGTFQPVKSDTIGEHRMHTEHFTVSKGMIDRMIAHIGGHRVDFCPSTLRPFDPSTLRLRSGTAPLRDRSAQRPLRSGTGLIFAVGTTSVRTLESLYWIGCKILENPKIELSELDVKQWEPYQEACTNIPHHEDAIPRCKRGISEMSEAAISEAAISEAAIPRLQRGISDQTNRAKEAEQALRAISEYLERNNLNNLETSTQIMILPGYQFRMIDGLVTNFHQPQSTLLLLIAAILGTDWRRVYEHALKEGYRFLSYGDANLYFCPVSRSQPDKI